MVTVRRGNVGWIVTEERAKELLRQGYRAETPLAAPPPPAPPARGADVPGAEATASEPRGSGALDARSRPPEPVILADADETEKLFDPSGEYLSRLSYPQLRKALAERGVPVAKTDKMADLKRKRDEYIEEIKRNRKAR